jgi:site-specific DNA-methyltransferase (adenine-specific)
VTDQAEGKHRAPNNRTLTVPAAEYAELRGRLVIPEGHQPLQLARIQDKTICADLFVVLDILPAECADLLIIDPPYNLNKNFHGLKFGATTDENYFAYLERWFPALLRTLKPAGSIYLCGDWKSSGCLYRLLSRYALVRNRITWQREKGRGATANWKNASEDIWFATRSGEYYFDAEAVKQKRRVLAPYREDGRPKDWQETRDGKFRLTGASNFWDDISVPYWSMPENTDHPTQKPEKLIAKLILASCPPGGLVLDPFLGSGTTSVVARKLGRHFIGIEINEEYCCWAEKRLTLADSDMAIQGYADGVFWERNSGNRI